MGAAGLCILGETALGLKRVTTQGCRRKVCGLGDSPTGLISLDDAIAGKYRTEGKLRYLFSLITFKALVLHPLNNTTSLKLVVN